MRKGVIKPATTDYTSTFAPLPKPDGSPNFYIDYSRFRAMNFRDLYPIPRMDILNLIKSQGNVLIFAPLNCNSRYCKIPMEDEYEDKKAMLSQVCLTAG